MEPQDRAELHDQGRGHFLLDMAVGMADGLQALLLRLSSRIS